VEVKLGPGSPGRVQRGPAGPWLVDGCRDGHGGGDAREARRSCVTRARVGAHITELTVGFR